MVWTGSLVAVGQQQYDPRLLGPLREPGGDKFIGDDLGTVHEIPVLGLPTNQGIGSSHRIAVLEPQGGIFRQQGIEDVERGLVGGEVLEGNPCLVRRLVDDGPETLGEGTATGILTHQAYPVAFHE